MPQPLSQRLRSGALISATVLLGISWSFALVRIHTTVYPLLWAAAMPLLSFYYFAGPARPGLSRHLPAAAMAIYAVVLWQVSRGYGLAGTLGTIVAVLVSVAAMIWSSRLTRAFTQSQAVAQAAAVQVNPAALELGSGVARRRRLRSSARRAG